MVSIKKSRIRIFAITALLIGFILLLFLSSNLESMANRDIKDVRPKYRSFQKIPVKVRYYIGKGALLISLTVPLLGFYTLKWNQFIILINSNGSGRIVFKHRLLRKPIYKDFASFKGHLTYDAPYVSFNPPLTFSDKTKLDKVFIPATWLLEGGRSSIEKFVLEANKNYASKT